MSTDTKQHCQNGCRPAAPPPESPLLQSQVERSRQALLRARHLKRVLARISPESGGQEALVVTVKLSRMDSDRLSMVAEEVAFTNEEYPHIVDAITDAIDRLSTREIDLLATNLSSLLGAEVTRVVSD